MLGLVALQGTLRVLDLKHAEIIVFPVQFFELGGVDLVLKLGDSQVFYFDWVGDRPLETDRYWG